MDEEMHRYAILFLSGHSNNFSLKEWRQINLSNYTKILTLPKHKDFAVDLILNQHKNYREVIELTGLYKSTLIRALNAYRGRIALDEKAVD